MHKNSINDKIHSKTEHNENWKECKMLHIGKKKYVKDAIKCKQNKRQQDNVKHTRHNSCKKTKQQQKNIRQCKRNSSQTSHTLTRFNEVNLM